MATEKAIALVVRFIEFSETSAIVSLFTREFGKVQALAKGARRPKGPFESALDLLGLCRIVFLRKSSDALDLLTEAKLERRFRVENAGLRGLNAAYYVAELLRELTDDGDPHPELFDAADATLFALGHARNAPAHVIAEHVFRFELTALRLLGHTPSLDACAECGTPIEGTGRTPFGHLAGGVLCPNCRAGRRGVVSLSALALAELKRIAAAEPTRDVIKGASEEGTSNPLRSARGELRGLLNHYIAHLVGRELRLPAVVSAMR